MNKTLIHSLIATTALTAGAAHADSVTTVDMTFTSVNPRQAVSAYLDYGDNGSVDWSTYTYAGNMNWLNEDTGDSFVTYCIELTAGVSYGATYTYSVDTSSSDLLTNLGLFWGQYQDSVEDLAGTYSGYSANERAAAFQLGVWELVYDGNPALSGLSVTAGDGVFYTGKSKAALLANTWLSGLDANGPIADLTIYRNKFQQDQVGGGLPTNVVAAPAPAAFGAGLLASVGLLGRRRRKA